MTWSIIARDIATARIGIAVSTKFFAVGSRVPHIKAGVGAIASQALMNPFYGPKGLELLCVGRTATEVVGQLTDADDGRAHRQLHVMDRQGQFYERETYPTRLVIDWRKRANSNSAGS